MGIGNRRLKSWRARPLRAWGSAAVRLCLLILSVGIVQNQLAPAQEGESLAGRLLVATPEMGDPNFDHTVIYMVSHDETGAMGLVVNRPLARGPISDLLKGFGAESEGVKGEIVLHYGGPVERERALVLHTSDYVGKTTNVLGGLAVTADVGVVQALARGEGPQRSLFALGYAGWAPGQLEAEIKANAWFSIPADEALLFEGAPDSKWERALARRKIKA